MATQETHTIAARSRIVDTDYAAETASIAKAQILKSAGQVVLKSALANPKYMLRLLRA